uniref:Mitochondrial rRNA methyltransferase 3a n=1 Tax=Cyclopterus lumpus TaxID=8103 RepID=A0A8C2Z3T7_CYCLU
MAAYMRSVICLVSTERSAFLSRGSGVFAEAKRYVRALKRRPVQVLMPDTETEKVLKPTAGRLAQRQKGGHGPATTKHPKEDFVKARSDVHSTVTHAVIKDHIDGLLSLHEGGGELFVARSRTFREQQGKILLEGKRLICDALDAGANPQMLFFSTADRLRELPLDKLKRSTLVKVKFEDIKIWSELVTPQGVIAIFSRPDPSRLKFASKGNWVPLSLICDNIRDPGNLGTMLRCAAAAGCHNVLLTKGCVDAWEPKVLRAAMGAHFRLPIYSSLDWDDMEKHLPKPVTVHVADINVSHKPSKAGDYGWVSTKPNRNMRYEEYDSDSDSDCEGGGLSLPRVDSKLYHESWAQRATALVIGGETHGLSVEAVQLAEKTAGCRLFIPVAPLVDSLNSAMAASILLFEGRKQLLKLSNTLCLPVSFNGCEK